MKKILLFTFFAILFGCDTNAQQLSWYFPWKNNLSSLVPTEKADVIPLLIEGKGYRIIKIRNVGNYPISINSFNYISQKSTGLIYYLPIINNYRGNRILDPIIEINNGSPLQILPNSASYFLIKLNGKIPGKEVAKFNLMENGKTEMSFNLNIFVSKSNFKKTLNLNLWSYLNFGLIGDIKDRAIEDLKNHGANVLVIPANVLQPVNSMAKFNGDRINSYLQGLKGNFSHYILYLGYNSIKNNSFILSRDWQLKFKTQISNLKLIFEKNGIDFSKIYLYPYDEPDVNQANTEVKMIKWCRTNGIMNPFFSTITNVNTVFISQYTKIIQVNSQIKGLMKAVKDYKLNSSEIWLYEIKAGSRNISAFNYLDLGWKASYYGLNGIGLWNYSFTGNNFNLQDFTRNKKNLGSWQTKSSSSNIDYSTIYRKGNTIYSSLRWEAISMGITDYNYLKLYSNKFGLSNKNILLNKLINGTMNFADWEKVKLGL